MFGFSFKFFTRSAVSSFNQMYEILAWHLSETHGTSQQKQTSRSMCWLTISKSEDCVKHVRV